MRKNRKRKFRFTVVLTSMVFWLMGIEAMASGSQETAKDILAEYNESAINEDFGPPLTKTVQKESYMAAMTEDTQIFCAFLYDSAREGVCSIAIYTDDTKENAFLEALGVYLNMLEHTANSFDTDKFLEWCNLSVEQIFLCKETGETTELTYDGINGMRITIAVELNEENNMDLYIILEYENSIVSGNQNSLL